ncbi:SDR family oxidoreductase [Temperatibacter marinus]|uniref:SDR family oxidoreductase n=1 Tax=Temperatibacter marinus TaxID=1456591 RepID=A0AA52EIW4_9PROT|nr:SDR family oxidoreductase [Temperatibacter marinus]WND02861.1 SDR family oxidoreductase [Temperatibacter marinus]
MGHKIVWITGASSGIGEAVSLEYAQRGAKIILSARREEELNRVREALINQTGRPDDYVILPLDVTDFDGMDKKVQAAFSFFGRVDLLFNNAGISQRSKAIDTDMDTYRKLFEVDVFGQIALTKQVLPLMMKQGQGHLAVTSSIAGKVGVPYRTGYCAAKHAMMGFFDALRAETVDQNIIVSCVIPGFIKTSIAENSVSGDGSRFGQKDAVIENGMPADQAARVIVNGFESQKKEIPVGRGSEMKALWVKRLFPELVYKMAAKMGAPKKT